MGSFANSIHVNCGDAVAVLDIIEKGMRDSGFEPTGEPVEMPFGFMESPVRGIDVFPSHNGWVCVLDSETMVFQEMAAELSRALGTHVIACLVNDSDSWHFQLYRDGHLVSSFDSLGGFEGVEEAGPTPANVVPFSPKCTMEELKQGAEKVQQWMDRLISEELRPAQERMASPSATDEDRQEYEKLVKEMPGRIQEEYRMFAEQHGLPPFNAAFIDSGAADADPDAQLEALRPILPPGTSDEQVLDVLGKQEVIAETVLAEFMGLLGIQSHFAYLSYQYLHEDTAEEDLAAAGVQPPTCLRYKPCGS